jgi:hypothetical protein
LGSGRAWNFAVFALAPYWYFRRRYSPTQLNLKSTNLGNDVLVIVVILAIESVVELLGFSSAIFDLTLRQVALGAPLTFAAYLVGTVLPTMLSLCWSATSRRGPGSASACSASPPGCSQPLGIKPRDPERRPQARLGVARLT